MREGISTFLEYSAGGATLKYVLSHARQQQRNNQSCENVDFFDELSGLYLSINKKKVVLKNALTIVHKIVYKEQFT